MAGNRAPCSGHPDRGAGCLRLFGFAHLRFAAVPHRSGFSLPVVWPSRPRESSNPAGPRRIRWAAGLQRFAGNKPTNRPPARPLHQWEGRISLGEKMWPQVFFLRILPRESHQLRVRNAPTSLISDFQIREPLLPALTSFPCIAPPHRPHGSAGPCGARRRLHLCQQWCRHHYYGLHRRRWSVVIPGSIAGLPVRTIGVDAFRQKNALTNIVIPNSVTSIENTAFANCGSLASATIPASVVTIGGGVFAHCASLSNIGVAAGSTTFSSMNGVLFDADQTYLIQYPAGRSGNYVIPASVITIGDAAFGGCKSLPRVTIPASVSTIGAGAFSACSMLIDIEVMTGNTAFSSVNGVLFNADQTTLIQHPAGKAGSYAIPAGVTTIGDSAFFENDKLTSVAIPAGVIAIGPAAFAGCRGLTQMAIPHGVTTLRSGTFTGCYGLISVDIPDSVTIIRNWVFQSCSRLASVTLPESITEIGNSAFANCTSLTSITIPGGVLSIENSAFTSCWNLVSVYIPRSVNRVGYSAFWGCSRLIRVTFEGNAPASISAGAFGIFNASGFTIYYYEGATGFASPKWMGYPTVMLPVLPTVDEWRKQHFGEEATNSGDAADDADPDGDGLANAAEYASGTDPKNAASQWQASHFAKTGAAYVVTFEAQPGRRYILQRFIPLPGAEWQAVAAQEPLAAAASVSLTDPEAPPDAALYRVQAALP